MRGRSWVALTILLTFTTLMWSAERARAAGAGDAAGSATVGGAAAAARR